MLKLTYMQRVVRACEDVNNGLSINLAASGWGVTTEAVRERIAYDNSKEGLDKQQAKYGL